MKAVTSCSAPRCSVGDRRPLPRGVALLLAGAAGLLGGCARLEYENTAPFITRAVRANDESNELIAFKAWTLYPARDILTFEWLARSGCGGEAWNADTDFESGTSFYTPRTAEQLTPEGVARGPCIDPPVPPYTIRKAKTGGSGIGFVGTDATGRKFLFKCDAPAYPELGTTAELVGSRILWALGYNVPAVHLVMIAGTGDERFDGRRATAAEFIDAHGHFRFDWFRYRREVRALRAACAWINDVDRGGRNNLVAVEDGHAVYCLIDFNSCLGSWQGRPREPWRGYQAEGDPAWMLLRLFSLGVLRPEPNPPDPVVSPAVGRFPADFSPAAWTPQAPNTAFDRMTPADLRWIAERIRRLDRPHIEAIVAAAQLSDRADAEYLVETLLARRAAVLRWAGG